jgi:transcriptional regulator with XRE-family HTH domain
MESTPGKRLQQWREFKGLSLTEMFRATGVKVTTLSTAESAAASNPSYDTITKVLAAFPDLNPDWLLLGTSSMLRDGRTLTQLPAALPPAVREGMPPVPGTATPEQADFVGKVIRSLEAQIESQARTIEWQQEQLAVLIKKPVPSLDAAPVYPLLPEQPRNRVGFATAASQECRVLAFVPAANPVEAERFGVAIGWR